MSIDYPQEVMLDERPMLPQELMKALYAKLYDKYTKLKKMLSFQQEKGQDIDGHLYVGESSLLVKAATILEQRVHNSLGTAPLSFEDPKHKLHTHKISVAKVVTI
ncbi:unnamed protein product [Thlaspi arvense]|uniref:Uncharacterized protein n=1 Tax=Thlaspi arvense TaxID=13288 RepID=A0AAU9RBB1_THLAR|nr:unnamed protein product [Thlaspi arvense]